MSTATVSSSSPDEDPPIRTLKSMLGDGVVFGRSEADLARHVGHPRNSGVADTMVLGVAYPANTEQVSLLMRGCKRLGVSVTLQGGMTGLVGGAYPSDDCLIVSLERMRAIEELDLSTSTMIVQAGVPLQVIQEKADAVGLLYPIDLGARGSCLIGGTIATNAGGNRVLRYGMTRELVLGLEVVLADGTIVSSLNKMLKNNAGYDLKHLFIGSEGTLGIITRAVVRLFPKARSSSLALCAATSYDGVLELLRRARSSLGGSLSAYEVMWHDFYAVATRARPAPLAADQRHYVLIETMASDPGADTASFNQLIQESYSAGVLADAVIAQSLREVAEFWAIRDASGELAHRFGHTVNFDLSVPTGEIDQFVCDCRSTLAARTPGTELLAFGHIADSNIHLACKPPDASTSGEIEAIVYHLVSQRGGSISAEHGIGLFKRDYLSCSRTAAEISLMKALKRELDPHNLLNPGKVLLVPEISSGVRSP